MNHFSQTMTLLGTVESIDATNKKFQIKLRTDDTVDVHVGAETYFSVLANIDGVDQNRVPSATGKGDAVEQKINQYIRRGDQIYVVGISLEHDGVKRFDSRQITLLHHEPGSFLFEEPSWWLNQIACLSDEWLHDLFGAMKSHEEGHFAGLYRSNLDYYGRSMDDNIQVMATLSRFIYGLSSSYLLTGDHRYLNAAAAGIKFQRTAFRMISSDGTYVLWAHGRKQSVTGSHTIIPSQNGDDQNAIALYEQIYGLAGLTQYYRITGDPEVLDDIRRTVHTFNRFFLDLKSVNPAFPGHDGYFTHIDPATMRPDTAALGPRASRKNWNSVGDHIPAYLVNILLALDPLPVGGDAELAEFVQTCKEILDRTTTLIIEKFPDQNPKVPYVNERFMADWTVDDTWGWQQDRAIIGHNLKIAWNLTRVASYYAGSDQPDKAAKAMTLAERLGNDMIPHGLDQIRGGCYDAVERKASNEQPIEFVWGNTKDFWQQEQGILAYLILYGYTGEQKYLERARDQSAFWNMFFLDRGNRSIYFRVSEGGAPVVAGDYANKASYAIAGYHAFELNYLAHVYSRAYLSGQGDEAGLFCLYFKPSPESGLRSINVLPDYLRPGSVEISAIWVNGRRRARITSNNFQIPLTDDDLGKDVVVQFRAKTPPKKQEATSAQRPCRPALPAGSIQDTKGNPTMSTTATNRKGKIGVLIEEHFDELEYCKFNKFFPEHGYQVDYMSHLWNQPKLTFWSNPEGGKINYEVDVRIEVNDVKPTDYKCIILIGGYAMDRVRYQAEVKPGQINRSPGLELVRRTLATQGVKLATICHSLWLLCADRSLLQGRRVTCAHNILCDVENAGGIVMYGQNEKTKAFETKDVFVDGNLISGRHPGVTDTFMTTILNEIER